MSIPTFGKVTPTQALMIRLAGLHESQKGDYSATMTRALETLTKLTGQNFGYNLKQWHTFLAEEENAKYGYAWGTASESLHEKILTMSNDPARIRLVGKLESENKHSKET